MPFWFALLMFAASTILGQLFRPKTSQPKPATLADIDAPTAESTRSVPKLYGTSLLKAPNVVSLTDFSSEAIVQKVSTLQKILSFGMAKKQTTGYKYFCGVEMALAYRVDELQKIIIGDMVAWSGSVTTDSEILINAPTLFGGNDPASGGNGGIYGYLGVHMGLPNATKDSYLVTQYGNYTAHRGIFYVIFKGQTRAKGSGYLGNSENIAAWQFVAKSIPNNLPYSGTNYSNINTGDANPAEVLYDIFRSAEYAIGMPAQYVDTASFLSAAQKFHTDGLGFSGLWDTSKPCRDIINNILQLTDSVIYSDLQTGKIVIKAARADYVVADIPSYTDKEILSISSYTRGAWAETTNYLTVPFVNRLNDFIQDTGIAFDVANQRIQGATIASNVQHVGISNPTTAANVAQRDLKAMTTPLAKVTFQISNKGYKTVIGSTFKFSTKRIKDHNGNAIVNMVMRCTGLRIGNPTNPVIEIEAIEDLFNSTSSIVAAPPSTSGTSPSVAPVATATALLDELPYMLAGDETARLWLMALAPNSGSYSFDMLTSLDNVTYDVDDPNNNYTPTGLLNAAYPYLTAAVDNSHVLVINATGASNLDKLGAATATEIANGKNLFLVIEGSKVEIMAFESYTLVSGNYQLNNVWRGLLDTTPQSFTSAARAWFFSYGDARSEANFLAGATGYAKILTRTLQGVLSEGSATAISKAMGYRSVRPYAPGNLRINTVYNGTIPGSGDITVAWSHRDRVRQGTVIAQNGASVGLEGGAKYTLKIFNQAGTLLRTVSDLVTESYIYTNAQETIDNGGSLANALTFQLFSTRDGVTSYAALTHGSARSGVTIHAPAYAASGTYVAPPAGNATSIGGVPISGTPTGTNNAPLYNPTTGLIEWQPAASISNEAIQDMLATFLVQGTYMTLTYNDAGNTLTVEANTAALQEFMQDMISTFVVNGTGLNASYNDAGNAFTVSVDTETIQDMIAALVTAGSGINVSYNDAGNILSLSVDAEGVQDIMATALVAGSGINITYNDPAGTILITSTAGGTSEPVTIGDDGATPPEFVWTDDGEIISV